MIWIVTLLGGLLGSIYFAAPGALIVIQSLLRSRRFDLSLWPAVLMLIAAVLSTLWATDTTIALYVLIQWSMALLLINVALTTDNTHIERALWTVLIIMAITALIEFILRLPTISRPDGITGNPNTLGGAMLPALALALNKKRWRWFAVFALTLLLSQSRSAWTGAAAGAVVYQLVLWQQASPLIMVWGSYHGTLALRVDLWRAGLMAWQDHPVTGVGAGNYYQAFIRYAQLQHEQVHYHAHNLFVQIASEMGTIGLISLAILIGAVVRTIAKDQSRARAQVATASALVVAVLVSGLFDYYYWLPANLLIMALSSVVIWRGETI